MRVGDHPVTPVETTRDLHRKLQAAGVPVVNLIYPQIEHTFDMLLPRIPPPFQATLYDIERFLALYIIIAKPTNFWRKFS